jgi:hypothetical protein
MQRREKAAGCIADFAKRLDASGKSQAKDDRRAIRGRQPWPAGEWARIPQAGQIAGANANVDQVRWVCNPWGRCWWRPNYYGAYGYYGPRPFYGRPWGWRHRWHRW